MKNLEKYLINFDELKKGDTVWHVRHGEAKILLIDLPEKEYPITIAKGGNFSKNGKFLIGDKYPSIYRSNPFLDLKEKPRMIEVLCDYIWKEKELIEIINGIAVYWNDNNKEYAYSAPFHYWREIQPKEEPLTLEQRIEKLEGIVTDLVNYVKNENLEK